MVGYLARFDLEGIIPLQLEIGVALILGPITYWLWGVVREVDGFDYFLPQNAIEYDWLTFGNVMW